MKAQLFLWIAGLTLGGTIAGCIYDRTVLQGTYIQQDAPGAKMKIQGNRVILTEGEGIKSDVSRITGRIIAVSNQKGRENFRVRWHVTRSGAIRSSWFKSLYQTGRFAGLAETAEGGIGGNRIVIYVPAGIEDLKPAPKR